MSFYTFRKQTPEHIRKRAKKIIGSLNGRYKDGRRSYRNIAGSKPGDKSIVHHKDGNRHNNSPSNLERLTDGKKPGARTSSKHEKLTKRK